MQRTKTSQLAWDKIEQQALRNYRNKIYTFKIGDKVLVTHALLIGLSKETKEKYHSCVGKQTTIIDIDTNINVWPYVLDIYPEVRWLECDLQLIK
jgi:hypothetical protein